MSVICKCWESYIYLITRITNVLQMQPQGYTFEAEANGHTFNVTVPMGGVEEGQRFSVPFNAPGLSSGFAGAAVPRASVPVGHWKVRWLWLFACLLLHHHVFRWHLTPHTSHATTFFKIATVGRTMRLLSLRNNSPSSLECVVLSIG